MNNETKPVLSLMKRMGLVEHSDAFLAPQGDKESDEEYLKRRVDPNIEVKEKEDVVIVSETSDEPLPAINIGEYEIT